MKLWLVLRCEGGGQQKRMHRSHATAEIPVNVARQTRRGQKDGVRLKNGGAAAFTPNAAPLPIQGV